MARFFRGAWLVLFCGITLGGCVAGTRADGDRPAAEYVDGQGQTGIAGQVRLQESGAPLAGAFVHVYPDTFSNLLGPSQFLSAPTDAAGRYRLEVPPGTYHVVARKRVSGQPTGPLSPGDYYSEHQRLVARAVAGKIVIVDLPVLQMRAPMLFKKNIVESDGADTSGIRGVLVDAAGQPVPGGFAIAYANADIQRAPDYVSTLTDADGRFTLHLPANRGYYLAGRIHAWDMPRPGEPYGRPDTATAEPVPVVENAFVEGVRIVMQPFAGDYIPGKNNFRGR